MDVKSDFLLYKIVNESAEKNDAHVLQCVWVREHIIK